MTNMNPDLRRNRGRDPAISSALSPSSSMASTSKCPHPAPLTQVISSPAPQEEVIKKTTGPENLATMAGATRAFCVMKQNAGNDNRTFKHYWEVGMGCGTGKDGRNAPSGGSKHSRSRPVSSRTTTSGSQRQSPTAE